MSTFSYELRLLLRDRAAWALTALFALVLWYALGNGAELAERQRASVQPALESAKNQHVQVSSALERQSVDPRQLARQPLLAVLPAAPLPMLAAGQADIAPSYESASLWRLQTPTDARVEIENPSRLLAGRFDLAFVLVWLFPLFLLALAYDLVAGDRESGTLRLVLSRGVAPLRWIAVRALARGAPMLSLALLATWASSWWGPVASHASDAGSRALHACALVAAWGLFWLSLSALVNAFARSAAAAATALGAAWVTVVLVLPTLLNVVVESLHPTPSRAELVASAREASGAAERRGNEVLNSFYRDHPELAPPGMRTDFAQQILAVQEEVARAVDPVRERFDAQLAEQQALIESWRFVSPAVAVYETLTDLAGTGYWRYRSFRDQVAQFKQGIYDFYSPRIHKNQMLTKADAPAFPRFTFVEEPAERWHGRVRASILGVLALALLACVLAATRLSPKSLSNS
jgi:ABC-2 type transport system permease protein